MSETVAVHVRYKSLYISLLSSAKQMTKARFIRRISAVSNSIKRIKFNVKVGCRISAARLSGFVALSNRNAAPIQTGVEFPSESNTYMYVYRACVDLVPPKKKKKHGHLVPSATWCRRTQRLETRVADMIDARCFKLCLQHILLHCQPSPSRSINNFSLHLKVFLGGHTVATVTHCVTKMITFSPMKGSFSYHDRDIN